MKKGAGTLPVISREHLRALCLLSDIPADSTIDQLLETIQTAPDPETAKQTVLGPYSITSDALRQKWHHLIERVWTDRHPHVPLLPALPLSANDLADTPALLDAQAFLTAVMEQPPRMVRDHHQWLMHPSDVTRIATALPSRASQPAVAVESEWSYVLIRRQREVLQQLRLIRRLRGTLVPVRSRIDRFRALPPAQQFFALWHVDVYHVDWAEYASLWGDFLAVAQDNVVLLWDAAEEMPAGQAHLRHHWLQAVADELAPFWEAEGLLSLTDQSNKFVSLLKQHTVLHGLDTVIVRDLLLRYGLMVTLPARPVPTIAWTKVGQVLLAAEREHDLPCGIDLLGPALRTII